MNLNYYFNPLDLHSFELPSTSDLFGNRIKIHTSQQPIEHLRNYDLALIGVPEDRNSLNIGCAQAPDLVRKKLYQLRNTNPKMKIFDLGNIKIGNRINDTYFAVSDIVMELLQLNVLPIIIGGSQELSYFVYQAYKKLEQQVSIVVIDSRIDLENYENTFNSFNYLDKIIRSSNTLSNLVHVGHQSYLTSNEHVEKLNNLGFQTYRLGTIRSNLREIEPILREADMISFDCSAIKQSDAPAHYSPSPNGFVSDEACAIARYAGLSDNISNFGIYETNPTFDNHHQTVHLAAQMIWYFVDGFYQRRKEDINSCKKYIVSMNEINQELVFYQSPLTQRWWIEIPTVKSEKKWIIACSQDDYHNACNQEIPDRWWHFSKKN